MHGWTTHALLEFNIWRKVPKTPACVQAWGASVIAWSLTLLRDGLDNQSWSAYEEKTVGFKYFKMTL